MWELLNRPRFIGISEEAVHRHFSYLHPGAAFDHSWDGSFGKYGQKYWQQVSDIYDWERKISDNMIFRPTGREILTGVELIIGDEFFGDITKVDITLEDDKMAILAEEHRRALTQFRYLAAVYQSPGARGREDFVILLLMMPDQHVYTFSANKRSPGGKQELHAMAVRALDKMLRNNTIPGVHQYGSMGQCMKVTSGSNWVNPYLTLEAFRVFIRESKRQQQDYEDWPDSELYSSLCGATSEEDFARDLWLHDLRGALGHRADQPLRIDPSDACDASVLSDEPSLDQGSHSPSLDQGYTGSDQGYTGSDRGYTGLDLDELNFLRALVRRHGLLPRHLQQEAGPRSPSVPSRESDTLGGSSNGAEAEPHSDVDSRGQGGLYAWIEGDQ